MTTHTPVLTRAEVDELRTERNLQRERRLQQQILHILGCRLSMRRCFVKVNDMQLENLPSHSTEAEFGGLE